MEDFVMVPKPLFDKIANVIVDVDFDNMCTQCLVCHKVVFDYEESESQHTSACMFNNFKETL